MIREWFSIIWKRRLKQAVVVLLAAALLVPSPAWAQGAPGLLTGRVIGSAGEPVAGVTVRAIGQNLTLAVTTDAGGRFAFSSLGLGEYDLIAAKGALRAVARVELTAGGADVDLTLQPLTTIQKVVTSRPSAPSIRGSGTDLTLNQSVLAHSPASTSFPSLLVQLPGAARGANGVVHINGDHGDINYIVDGVSIPQELNRELGSEFDVANAAYVDVLEGAYPAQYGGRGAGCGVLLLWTRER